MDEEDAHIAGGGDGEEDGLTATAETPPVAAKGRSLLDPRPAPTPMMTLVQAVCGLINELLTLIFFILLALKLEGQAETFWLTVLTPVMAACVVRPALASIRIPFVGAVDVEEVLGLMSPGSGSKRKLAYVVRVVENLLLFSALFTLGIHLDSEDPTHEAVARDAFFVLLGLYLMLLCPLLFYHTVASIRGHKPSDISCCSGPGFLAGGLVLAIAVQYVLIIVKVEEPETMEMGAALIPLAFCVVVGVIRTVLELREVLSIRSDAVDDDDRSLAVDAIGYVFFGVFFILLALKLGGVAAPQWPLVFAPVFAASVLELIWVILHELVPLCSTERNKFEEL